MGGWMDGRESRVNTLDDGWKEGRKGGWMEGKTGLRIAYSNKKKRKKKQDCREGPFKNRL